MINHPAMGKHKSFIIESVSDLEDWLKELRQGDSVSFELYTGKQGVGAKEVRPESLCSPNWTSRLRLGGNGDGLWGIPFDLSFLI